MRDQFYVAKAVFRGGKINRLLISVLFGIVIGGCATGPIDTLPSLKDENRAGGVTIIRPSSVIRILNYHVINVDGQDIFKIWSGQHTKFRLDEGDHYIGVKCVAGFLEDFTDVWVRITIGRNNPVYLLVSPKLYCAEIREITEEEAQKEIQETEYVPME